MHCNIFHNPQSGLGHHTKAEVTCALQLAGYDTSYHSTKKAEDIVKLLKKPADIIVVAGGDGTVAKILANVTERDVPIAILPLGTANNIARSIGVFGSPIDLPDSWRMDHWRPLDIGIARGPWGTSRFVEAVGIGPVAKAIRKPLKTHGAIALRDGRRRLAKIMRKAKPLKLSASLDGSLLPGELISLEITNIAYGGPGLPLAPDTDHGDGLLEIIAVGVDHRDEMAAWLEAPLSSPPPVTRLRAKHLTLAMEGAPLRVDDEYYAPPKQPETVSVQLESAPVRILVRPPVEARQAQPSGRAAHGR